MPTIPPADQQSAPTRGDLLLAIAAVAQQNQAVLAAVLNTQQAITALNNRLTAAGIEAEPEILAAILAAARTD